MLIDCKSHHSKLIFYNFKFCEIHREVQGFCIDPIAYETLFFFKWWFKILPKIKHTKTLNWSKVAVGLKTTMSIGQPTSKIVAQNSVLKIFLKQRLEIKLYYEWKFRIATESRYILWTQMTESKNFSNELLPLLSSHNKVLNFKTFHCNS